MITREEFIKLLDQKGYTCVEEGNKIVITHLDRKRFDDNVWFNSLESIPPNVEFRNDGDIMIRYFMDGEPSDSGIPSSVEFNNGSDVWLNKLGWFGNWKGNIDDINSKQLLNKMVSDGLFDKEKR